MKNVMNGQGMEYVVQGLNLCPFIVENLVELVGSSHVRIEIYTQIISKLLN